MAVNEQPKPARLPYYFQFFFIILPFAFFLFEFRNPPNVFTDYQYYVIGFLVLSYFVAVFTAHRSLGRIVFAVSAIIVLPIWLERVIADFIGTLPFVNPDFLYYASGYLAIFMGYFYLSKSDFPAVDHYKLKFDGKKNIVITLMFAVLSATVLFVYFHFSDRQFAMVSSEGAHLYLGMITAFAFANGVMEELWFRGMFQSVLAKSFPIRFAVIYQALLFGIIHYDGTPSGPVGVTLAFIFGLALGWLTVRTNSILPAIIVHVVADFVIGLYL